MKGAQREGLAGFGKGLVGGLVGILAKPTVGCIDLISQTAEGIKVFFFLMIFFSIFLYLFFLFFLF